MTREEPVQPTRTGRYPLLAQGVAQFSQIRLRPRLAGREDQGRMRLDAVGVPVASHRLRRDVTLLPEAGVPADRCRLADPEALRRLAARGTDIDRRNDALAQIRRQGGRHGDVPYPNTASLNQKQMQAATASHCESTCQETALASEAAVEVMLRGLGL